jgi:hypothetical protein
MNNEIVCPVCGGPVWDNRESKRNPKAPDYKCRDKNCDGVIWPERSATRTAPARSTVSGEKLLVATERIAVALEQIAAMLAAVHLSSPLPKEEVAQYHAESDDEERTPF